MTEKIQLPNGVTIDEDTGDLILSTTDGERLRVTADGVEALGSLALPKYDDLADAPAVEGLVVYATGNGPDDAGVYKNDGTAYGKLGGGGSGGGVTDFRTDDPDNPEVGQAWFRTDLNVVRRNADGNVVEERGVYDVPTTTVLENFEGKTVSDLTITDLEQGSPLYAVVERDGSDWLEIDCASGDGGGVNVGNNGKVGFRTRLEISNSDGTAIVARGSSDPTAAGTLFFIVSGSGGLTLRYINSSGTQILDSISSPPSSEFVGSPVDVEVFGQENGTVTFEVTTTQDTYTLSGSVGNVNPDLTLFGQSTSTAKVYYDYAESAQYDGEISPDLKGYLKDRNVIISEDEPSDTSKLWYNSGTLQKYDDGSSSWIGIIKDEFIQPSHVQMNQESTSIEIDGESITISGNSGSYNFFSNELRLNRSELYLGHDQINPFVFKSRGVPIVIESNNGASSVEVSDSGVSMSGDVSGAVERGFKNLTGDGATTQFTVNVETDRETYVVVTPNNDPAMTKDYLATKVQDGSFDLVFDSPPADGETLEFMYMVA